MKKKPALIIFLLWIYPGPSKAIECNIGVDPQLSLEIEDEINSSKSFDELKVVSQRNSEIINRDKYLITSFLIQSVLLKHKKNQNSSEFNIEFKSKFTFHKVLIELIQSDESEINSEAYFNSIHRRHRSDESQIYLAYFIYRNGKIDFDSKFMSSFKKKNPFLVENGKKMTWMSIATAKSYYDLNELIDKSKDFRSFLNKILKEDTYFYRHFIISTLICEKYRGKYKELLTSTIKDIDQIRKTNISLAKENLTSHIEIIKAIILASLALNNDLISSKKEIMSKLYFLPQKAQSQISNYIDYLSYDNLTVRDDICWKRIRTKSYLITSSLR
ncbi:hypothetical protein KJ940_01290 [Myxococcota bacterium]|nr:hypothetical protein [Myxococcota bacterium]